MIKFFITRLFLNTRSSSIRFLQQYWCAQKNSSKSRFLTEHRSNHKNHIFLSVLLHFTLNIKNKNSAILDIFFESVYDANVSKSEVSFIDFQIFLF